MCRNRGPEPGVSLHPFHCWSCSFPPELLLFLTVLSRNGGFKPVGTGGGRRLGTVVSCHFCSFWTLFITFLLPSRLKPVGWPPSLLRGFPDQHSRKRHSDAGISPVSLAGSTLGAGRLDLTFEHKVDKCDGKRRLGTVSNSETGDGGRAG